MSDDVSASDDQSDDEADSDGAEAWSEDESGEDWASGVVTPARWRMYLAEVLSLIGLGVSIYLTVDHFAKIAPVCSGNGIVTCKAVTTSPQSYFPPFHGWPHLPVAFLGLCFYIVLVAINLPAAWRSQDRRVHLLRFGLLCVGMAFALYLVACELLIIGKICLWCTSVHVITFCLFVLTVSTVPTMLGWGRRTDVGDDDTASDGFDEAP